MRRQTVFWGVVTLIVFLFLLSGFLWMLFFKPVRPTPRTPSEAQPVMIPQYIPPIGKWDPGTLTTPESSQPQKQEEKSIEDKQPLADNHEKQEVRDEESDGVLPHLKWLSKQQNKDGSFGEGAVMIDGYQINQTGMTALALLNFLGAGYFHSSKNTYDGVNFGNVVRQGLKWLMDHQTADGFFTDMKSDPDLMFNNALAILAMNEAYGLSESTLFKDSAQKATTWLAQQQSPWYQSFRQSGWSRTPNGPVNRDLLTTAQAVLALKSAELGSLDTGDSMIHSTEYLKVMIRKEPGNPQPILAYMFAKREKTAAMETSVKQMIEKQNTTLFMESPLFWYYGTMAAFQYDGPDGAFWKTWNQTMKKTMLEQRAKEGYWGEGKPRSEQIVLTSLAGLNLEIYYSYASVFGAR